MPIPTVLRFYTLERKIFWLFTQNANFSTFSESDFPQITTMPTAPTVPTKPKNWQFSCFERPQIRLFDHLLKPKMSHFQDLRSSKVPLTGFESPDLLQIRLFDHLLKPKMSHFQDLRSSKVPLTGFEKLKMSHFQVLTTYWSPKSTTFRIWETRFSPNKPLLNFRWTDPEPRLGSNHRSKLGQVASTDPTSWLHLSTSISVSVAST